MEVFFQDRQQLFVNFLLHLQADDLTPLPLLQLFLDFLQQIFRLILIDTQVSIAHDTVRISTKHVIVQEQLLDIPLDNLFKKQECPHSLRSGRNLHNPWQHGRYLDSGKLCLPFLVFLLRQQK